jgi:putative transposase
MQGSPDGAADVLPVGKEYGGLQLEQAKRLKELQKETAQLRRAVADLTVEKQVLKDIAQGNF